LRENARAAPTRKPLWPGDGPEATPLPPRRQCGPTRVCVAELTRPNLLPTLVPAVSRRSTVVRPLRHGRPDLHPSVGAPAGRNHRFLLNPFGYLFDEITASSLIAVGAEGHAIEKLDEAKINNAGFTIHSAVHMARCDAQCVTHSDTTAGMAVAAQERVCCP
jgi:ribulose-5-phosphate 4-epimerase/fuculose-1-phosphate aldolase